MPDDMQKLVEQYRGQLIEAAAESDDSLLEKYLDAGTLSEEEIPARPARGNPRRESVARVCCSATKLLGVRTLMSTIAELMPPPQVEPRNRPRPSCSAPAATSSAGSATSRWLRARQSRLSPSQLSRGGDERLAQIFFPRGKEHVNTAEVRAGDIGAATKLTHTLTGDTIGMKDGGPLPPLDLPGPPTAWRSHPRRAATRRRSQRPGPPQRRKTRRCTWNVSKRPSSGHLSLGDVHLDVTAGKAQAQSTA